MRLSLRGVAFGSGGKRGVASLKREEGERWTNDRVLVLLVPSGRVAAVPLSAAPP
jgi:hypothetical protein